MLKETVVTGLGLAGKLPDLIRSSKSDSLIEYTQATRVEPIVLVDERVIGFDYTSDIMHSLVSLVSGYYLQAVAITVNVGKVDVIGLLDKLNPKRSVTENLASGVSNGVAAVMSMESFQYALPRPGQAVGLECFGEAVKRRVSLEDDQSSNGFGKDQVAMLSEVTNLSVGKMLEVHIESQGHKAVFPIAVRLICQGLGAKELTHILTVGSSSTSLKERWHAWRAGQIEFVRDMVFCQDLIDAHKNALRKDTSGIYAEILNRRKGNKLSAIFSGNPSVATASNLVVMADSTAKDIERTAGGLFKNFAFREKIFKATYVMIIAVVDPQWEVVKFYHRSIDVATEMSIKELKVSNKSKGPDVGEILKAYQLGSSPSI